MISIPLPRHNEQRHIKRMSRPVHGGRTDPKKKFRIYCDRWSTRRGEMEAWMKLVKRTFTGNQQWEAEWSNRSKKHNLAPRGPKHNALRKAILKQRDSLFRYTAS